MSRLVWVLSVLTIGAACQQEGDPDQPEPAVPAAESPKADAPAEDPILAKLDSTRVSDLEWKAGDITLGGAMQYLRAVTGQNFVLSMRVLESRSDLQIEVHASDLSARQLLDLLLEPNGMKWGVRNGVVMVEESGETARTYRTKKALSDEETEFLDGMLRSRRVSLAFEETGFPQVVAFLKAAAGVEFVIDPGAKEDLEAVEITLSAQDVLVEDALELVMGLVSPEGEYLYEIAGRTVRFVKP